MWCRQSNPTGNLTTDNHWWQSHAVSLLRTSPSDGRLELCVSRNHTNLGRAPTEHGASPLVRLVVSGTPHFQFATPHRRSPMTNRRQLFSAPRRTCAHRGPLEVSKATTSLPTTKAWWSAEEGHRCSDAADPVIFCISSSPRPTFVFVAAKRQRRFVFETYLCVKNLECLLGGK